MATTQHPQGQTSIHTKPSTDFDPSLHALQQIWPCLRLTRLSVQTPNYKTLTAYFSRQIEFINNGSSTFAAQTLKETIDLLPKLRSLRSKTKTEVVGQLKTDFPSATESAIQSSLELAVSIWLTISVDSHGSSSASLEFSSTTIEWEDDRTLEESIIAQFREARSPVQEGNMKYNKKLRLTVANLVTLAKLDVEWTSNLVDHLDFDRTTQTLKIYQHKICLLNHLSHARKEDPFIPLAVIEETIDTLNLLFPIGDKPTKYLLASEGQVFNAVGNCSRQPYPDLKRYVYWGERLQELTNILNERPQTFKELMSSRATIKDSINLWNLGIATFVLLLTVLNIVFGVFATVYTYKQYQLARLQFCLQTELPKIPPGLC